ncbi:hypothetical protein [Cohnella boryungensis]|uniref:Uncharacterized protein n=1 Tax=Cohnella boryungensis TaxID=768479 RepID=A0ABV8SBB7_9BACL
MEEVSYSELDHAFDNTPNLLPWDNYIYLLTPLPGSDYTFDGGWVIENIRHYLESTDSLASARLYTKRPPSLYGVNALRRFAKELEEGAFRGNHYIASHILWEHKKCMRDRFIYMMNNQSYDGVILNSFIARFDKIYRDAEVLKNMSLRANLTSDRSLPRRMSSQIKAICENDIEVLTEILPLLVELNAAREFIPERSL